MNETSTSIMVLTTMPQENTTSFHLSNPAHSQLFILLDRISAIVSLPHFLFPRRFELLLPLHSDSLLLHSQNAAPQLAVRLWVVLFARIRIAPASS